MSVMRLLTLIVILFSLNITLFGQSFSMKGQFWASGTSVEDQSDLMSQLGYIPTFSVYYKLSQERMVDLEWAYRFGISYIGESLEEQHEKLYRGWLRYSTQGIEARVGLQKVSFGPARMLRPLAWFDTIDPEDPTGQTEGVEALRLRFFPSNSLALWTWIMKGKSDTLSYGGRGELSTSFGEWGFTLHQDPAKGLLLMGDLYPVLIADSHTRIGVDFRYDGFLGFWFEAVGLLSENQKIFNEDRYALMTLGADYTLPFGAGLHIMSETMRIKEWSSKTDARKNQTISAFMASIPLGMFHNLMFFSNLDWNESRTYNYLRWSSTYDRFSINFIASVNPIHVSNSLGLILIYHH